MEIKYEDYCKRIDEVMSFYQSKRAGLKKQLTHWIGKFMIVKQENNRLRMKLRKAEGYIEYYRSEILHGRLTGMTAEEIKTGTDIEVREPIKC